MGHPVYIHLESDARPADGGEAHGVAPVQAEVHQVLAPSLESVAFATIFTLSRKKITKKVFVHILYFYLDLLAEK